MPGMLISPACALLVIRLKHSRMKQASLGVWRFMCARFLMLELNEFIHFKDLAVETSFRVVNMYR